MPLVDVSALHDPEVDRVIEQARRWSTPKPAWYQTLASNPSIAKAFAHYWDAAWRNGRVEHEIKELMRIAVAPLLGCSFRASQTICEGRGAGAHGGGDRASARSQISATPIAARAAWRLARELALDDAGKDPARFDAVYGKLHEVFDDEEIMELAGICVLFFGGTRRAEPRHRRRVERPR